MYEVNHKKTKAAIDQLKQEYVRWNTNQAEIPDDTKGAAKQSLMLKFRSCSDVLLEYIQNALNSYGLVHVNLYPINQTYRMAHEAHLIDVEMLARFFKYNKKRDTVSSAKNPKQMDDVLTVVGDFIEDASDVYETISQKQ